MSADDTQTDTQLPEVYDKGYLPVSDGHDMYYTQAGDPEGMPVVYLHGGPGSPMKDKHRRFFDAKKFRIVQFDQRGCGQSRPLGSTKGFSIEAIVQDMEALREKLDIDKWLVMGGSWGSTVGLYYAERFPERVTGLIMANIWLCRKQDLQYMIDGGKYKDMFPEAWKAYKREYSDGEVFDKYYEAIMGDEVEERNRHIVDYANWETALMNGGYEPLTVEDIDEGILANFRILFYFYKNPSVLYENYILDHVDKLTDIPIWLVHGEVDYLCPVEQAKLLADKLPSAKLTIAKGAGHGTSTFPEIDQTLHKAVAEFIKMKG